MWLDIHRPNNPPSCTVEIRVLQPLPLSLLHPLVEESTREGYRFLRRLESEYEAGELRFDGPGEVLLGVFDGRDLVAVGGVSRDPYEGAAGTGRIRHVYVRATHRRRGVGRELVAALEAHARGRFSSLVLRTDTEAAARFYSRLGYQALPPGGTATHRRDLP